MNANDAAVDPPSAPLPPPSAPTRPDGRDRTSFAPPEPSVRAGDDIEHQAISDPDAPVLIGVSFDGTLLAQEYLLAMKRLRNQGALELKDAVVVTKNDDGKVMVTETLDPTPGRAALSGGVWTGLLGLFVGGPVGWLAGLGVGAGVGAITAKIVDLGIPDEWVGWFKDSVSPGTSTIIILAEHVSVQALVDEAHRFEGAEVLYTTMQPWADDELRRAFGS